LARANISVWVETIDNLHAPLILPAVVAARASKESIKLIQSHLGLFEDMR
jgi:hypothetical protein